MKTNIITMKNNSGKVTGKGRLKTMRVDVVFHMEPITAKPEKGKPSHKLTMTDDDGEFFEVGVAWPHQINNGELTGITMYSLQFTDPDMPDWMASGVPAFPTSPAADEYRIDPKRQRKAD